MDLKCYQLQLNMVIFALNLRVKIFFIDFTLAITQKIVCNTDMVEDKKYEINVIVRTTYLPEQSDETLDRYVFAYTITIANTGMVAAQLISRHWIIEDGGSNVQEVRGLGVVGEQPMLKPGDSFEYTSGTAISSPVGSMKGSYRMVAEDGIRFNVLIPEFTLSVPRTLH